jgi:hypothetical protein
MFDVGRSMFDVQSFHCSGQAEFHTRGSGVQGSGVQGSILVPGLHKGKTSLEFEFCYLGFNALFFGIGGSIKSIPVL